MRLSRSAALLMGTHHECIPDRLARAAEAHCPAASRATIVRSSPHFATLEFVTSEFATSETDRAKPIRQKAKAAEWHS